MCDECNNDDKSKDDSFLRDLLVVDKDAQGSSTARFIRLDKFESSVKQNKSEFNRIYLSKAKKIPMIMQNGIYVYGKRINVDVQRLIKIFKRIVLGLFYSQFDYKIDDKAQVTIFKKVSSYEEFKHDFEFIKKRHRNGFFTGNLGHTFHFKVQIVIVKEQMHSYWWLVFYETVCYFLAMRSPFEDKQSL